MSFGNKMGDAQTHDFVCSFYNSPKLQRSAITLLADSAPALHTHQVCSFVRINFYVINLRWATYDMEGVYEPFFLSVLYVREKVMDDLEPVIHLLGKK